MAANMFSFEQATILDWGQGIKCFYSYVFLYNRLLQLGIIDLC